MGGSELVFPTTNKDTKLICWEILEVGGSGLALPKQIQKHYSGKFWRLGGLARFFLNKTQKTTKTKWKIPEVGDLGWRFQKNKNTHTNYQNLYFGRFWKWGGSGLGIGVFVLPPLLKIYLPASLKIVF